MNQLGNLDSNSSKDVIELLKKVAKDKLVIVVTHNFEQVEQYATRVIKMHDGKIVENKVIKQVEAPEKVKESKYNKITIGNKYRLGIRNTFNIVTKFLLLLAVFLFITVALLSEYASFAQTEYETNKYGYNYYFRDLSDNRILIKKADGTYFTQEDYNKIGQIENVDYIVEDDLLIDSQFTISKDDIYFYGRMQNYNFYKGTLTEGRVPENKYEIILKIPEDYYYVRDGFDNILEKEFEIRDNTTNETKTEYKLKIVGIEIYDNDSLYGNSWDTEFYVGEEVIEDFRKDINQAYSKVKTLFNGKYYQNQIGSSYFRILPSDKVEKGNAIVSEELNSLAPNYRAKNRELKIFVENIYYQEELTVKIYNTYTKNSFTKLTGYKEYDLYNGSIFINKEEYINFYNKEPYQSSIYIKDEEKLEETIIELEQINMEVSQGEKSLIAQSIKNFKINDNLEILQIIKIFKLVVTCILILALFFISYFIIRIILKSRNVYFTTLRMLGATTKDVKRILDIELFINSSLAYLSFMVLIALTKYGVINVEFISNLVEFLSFREYALMYVILIVMSRLISRRFSKKIFKKSAIKTYNEEV